MMILIVATAVGLTRFGAYVSSQAQKRELSDGADAGIVVRYEPLCLWLPSAFVELAKRQSQSTLVRMPEDLRQSFELEHQEGLWYALIVRAHQLDSGFNDVAFIRRPYDDPDHFPELLDVLATAAGNPPRGPHADFSNASVQVLSEELLKRREPRQVMVELLGDLGSGF